MLLQAIDIGSSSAMAAYELGDFTAFSGPFVKDNKHPFGPWFRQHAQSDLLRNICVKVHSDNECEQLRQLLSTLPPAQHRHCFAAEFRENIDGFTNKIHDVLTLLRQKSPSLETLSLDLLLRVSPALFMVIATELHPNVTSFCLRTE